MLWHGRYLNPSVSLREPAPLRTGELSSGLEKLPCCRGAPRRGEGLYQRITGLKILILNTIGLQIRLNKEGQGSYSLDLKNSPMPKAREIGLASSGERQANDRNGATESIAV